MQAREKTGADRPLSQPVRLCDSSRMAPPVRPRLTAKEAGLIRRSFEKVVLNPTVTSARFYQRLFALDPSLRALFHGDMREQGKKLISTLALIVDSIDQLENLLPMVRELGVRHANYRVEERHYATVGEALIWALAQTGGRSFTAATRTAWQKAYDILAETMIDAARSAAMGSPFQLGK